MRRGGPSPALTEMKRLTLRTPLPWCCRGHNCPPQQITLPSCVTAQANSPPALTERNPPDDVAGIVVSTAEAVPSLPVNEGQRQRCHQHCSDEA